MDLSYTETQDMLRDTLARFLADGLGDKLADDGDGALTAIELSEYVHARYRADVKSAAEAAIAGIKGGSITVQP